MSVGEAKPIFEPLNTGPVITMRIKESDTLQVTCFFTLDTSQLLAETNICQE